MPLFNVSIENIDKTLNDLKDDGKGLAKFIFSTTYSKIDAVEGGLDGYAEDRLLSDLEALYHIPYLPKNL